MTFLQFYTTQAINWDVAVKNVHDSKGHIFVCVVEAVAKGATTPSLNYGFFYRHEDGTLADCLQSSRTMLKTVRTADLAFQMLLEAYQSAHTIALPVLSKENMVVPGQVTNQVLLSWDSPPTVDT